MALSEGFDWSKLEGIDWSKIDGPAWATLVRERFPASAWVLDHPELETVIRKAIDEDQTPDTFANNLRATDWYTTRTEAERSWDIFAADTTNAAEKADRLADAARGLADQASQLGLEVSAADLEAIALRSLREGLEGSQVTGLLLDRSTGNNPGAFVASQDAVQAAGRQYLVDVSDEEAAKFARKLFTGEWTEANVAETMQKLAYQRHPGLRELLDNDVSPEEFFRPHQQRLAAMLGREPDQIDLMGEFSAVTSIGDGGSLRPMSVAETERYGRSLDEYWQVPGGEGETELYGMVDSLARAMGRRR